jgi:hypothetical protein
LDSEPVHDGYPEASAKDRATTIVVTGAKAVIATVPFAGGLVEVLDAAMRPALARRREAWERKLGELVEELETRFDGFDPAKLSDNDLFITGVIEASRIAVGEYLEEKLDMLKACLVHMALPEAMPDFIAMRFLRFVDELELQHFLVLRFAMNPRAWFEERQLPQPSIYAGPRRAVLDAAEMGVSGDVLEVVVRDLSDRRLVDAGMLSGVVNEHALWQEWATDVGRDLIDFVTVI